MALEEVTFINMVGDEVNLTNLVSQMIDFYNQKLEVGETKITDFNEGSEIRNLLEAFAILSFAVLEDENEATKLPFIESSYGTFLDKIGENPFINLPRITGDYAVGNATFTLADEQDTDIIIPGDTLLENSEELQFVTDSDCTIYAGETTGEVSVTCLTMGYDGNIPSNSLTVIADGDVDTTLISVTNPEEFMNGADLEDDEDYRTRLLENVRSEGFGTLEYYTKLGESVDGVHDILFVEATGYTRKALVNGYVKPTPDAVLLDTLTEYSEVNNIVLGHSFIVDTPDYVSIDLTIDLDVTVELDEDILTTIFTKLVYGGSFEQMEFTGLNIGENLTQELLTSIMNYLSEIVSMTIYETGESSEFTTTNIDSDEAVELGTLTFNQNVV